MSNRLFVSSCSKTIQVSKAFPPWPSRQLLDTARFLFFFQEQLGINITLMLQCIATMFMLYFKYIPNLYCFFFYIFKCAHYRFHLLFLHEKKLSFIYVDYSVLRSLSIIPSVIRELFSEGQVSKYFNNIRFATLF